MANEIDSLMQEARVFLPPENAKKHCHIPTLEKYNLLYQESIESPETFWARQANEHIEWFKPWDNILTYNFTKIGTNKDPYIKWFDGGKLNLSFNCIDRHILSSRRNKAAIIWQGESDDDRRTLTYLQLHTEVCRFANVLKKQGVQRGSRVTIFLPMIPELPIAMLACARIGAIHSVVFSAFSASALRDRIIDCASEIIITADTGVHGGKTILLKQKTDEAIQEGTSIRCVIVYQRGDGQVPMMETRDIWWHNAINDPAITNTCDPESMDSESPLFILYTSGSTGKPKGVLHTTAGYLLYTHLTSRWIFDLKDEDIHWCTADIGWITGHSYIVYGPLSNGATTLMFEGIPTYPHPNRFWKIIEDHRVSVFYTAPTAIRALMRFGDTWPNQHDLSSLRILGSVGEPINPEAWMWYYRVIGKERCPLLDTWWQTETGGILIAPLPGAIPTKPGSASKPFFGIQPEVLRQDGSKTEVNEGGHLVLTAPWPGMIRGVYGDINHSLIKNVYFSHFPGKYFTGDGCRIDSDGFYWLLGRIDDVVNVSGHRLGTAEIESALVSHSSVAEAAVVGIPDEIKGQSIYCFVTLKQDVQASDILRKTLTQHVRETIGPIATPDRIQFTDALPKTRSGKIVRRILRKIATGDIENIGDTTTLSDPSLTNTLVTGRIS
tara:strand:- start:2927 stop:4921 length:1995 start_codon:yes stop_codon:yes gene_type:complete